jgi:hypothetical protein
MYEEGDNLWFGFDLLDVQLICEIQAGSIVEFLSNLSDAASKITFSVIDPICEVKFLNNLIEFESVKHVFNPYFKKCGISITRD